jgi:hypothetical protein
MIMFLKEDPLKNFPIDQSITPCNQQDEGE